MSDSVGISLALGLVKSVVCVYDVLTLPVYMLAQQPWKAQRRSAEPKSKKIRPDDPYSPWVRIGSPPDHDCYRVNTVNELFSATINKYKTGRSFGYRKCYGEEDERQPDGKVFKKQILADEYVWLTYVELDERIDAIARGLMLHGVKPRDVVLIMAETRLEWMLSAQAIFRLGATIATLYATLGDDGIVHGFNETAVSVHARQFPVLSPRRSPVDSVYRRATRQVFLGRETRFRPPSRTLIANTRANCTICCVA